MKEWRSSSVSILENKRSFGSALPGSFSTGQASAVLRFHRSLAAYEKTPLVRLSSLAESLGVKDIFVKDESSRFGLNAFKGLGGSYAMFRILCEKFGLDHETAAFEDIVNDKNRAALSQLEFVTCTDGNHGKGVSWAAGLFGCRAHVFMPFGTVEARVRAIQEAGPAEVTVTDMSYDDTVRHAGTMSREKGWILIQDTSWSGYEQIPEWIIRGYLTLAAEAAEDLDMINAVPTHVFLQAGVGSMAGGVAAYLADRYSSSRPVTVIVEPTEAACVYESAKADDGTPRSVSGSPVTIMAGLNCGTVCSIVWPVLRDHAQFYISCSDQVAEKGMRLYAFPSGTDSPVISGGSGASTLGALHEIMTDPDLEEARASMGLNSDSVILLINTEGNTDPESYENVVTSSEFFHNDIL